MQTSRKFSENVDEPVHPLDRIAHAAMGRVTGGLSPSAIALACTDWALHVAASFGKQSELATQGMQQTGRLGLYAAQCVATGNRQQPCVEPSGNDDRFQSAEWQRFPFNMLSQSFLLNQSWWHQATTDVRGVTPHHEQVVNFLGRQVLDVFSPSNYLLTNPEVLRRTVEERGQNLLRGARNFVEDTSRTLAKQPPVGADKFQVGRDMAATPGKVVYRNQLMELIQYEPTTDKVHPEPVLVVPAWIMKYYILDLKPGKSLVEYLVSQGHTVFVVSWKNPGAEDRDMGMEHYRNLGVMEALDAVRTIVPDQKVHGVGYCLGGTLLMLAASAMARDGDDRLASLSLFAAQCDFTEPGELDLFIDESQVTFLEDTMWDQGYLKQSQMAGAFQLLRSQDLLWSRMLRHYLMGEREPMIELMAWNADATRMPARMHSEYLRTLFLNNDFVEGRYDVDGQPIHLGDIRVPIFAVGTEKDHVAPWKSVYKIIRFSRTDVTFALTGGGHNAGIVTQPGHPRRTYQVHEHKLQDRYLSPEEFQEVTPNKQGSWWPEWQSWLAKLSGKRNTKPPQMGLPGQSPLADAPGEYVRQT